MFKNILNTFFVISLVFFFSACLNIRPPRTSGASIQDDALNISYNNLNDIVDQMTDELFESSSVSLESLGSIAVTSFVDLHHLNDSTYFGQVLSEAFINQLYKKGMNVVDFRGRTHLNINPVNGVYSSVDANGNKVATRRYVFVGTYLVIGNSVLLNARITDNTNGKLVASSREILQSSSVR